MTDAQTAIADIQEALEEYGTNISLKKVTAGAYNPLTGDTADTVVSTSMKAFINTSISSERLKLVGNYDAVFTFYTSEAVDESYKISYESKDYQILHISRKVLQNTSMLYEATCKR